MNKKELTEKEIKQLIKRVVEQIYNELGEGINND